MRIYFTLFLLILISGCSSRTRIVYNEDFNIETNKSFNVRGLRIEPSFGSAIPVAHQQKELLSTLTEILSAKGYKHDTKSPDFIVTLRVSATDNTNLLGREAIYMKGADSSFVSIKPRTKIYQSDSLVLEISKGLNRSPSIIGLCNIREGSIPEVRGPQINNRQLRLDDLSECTKEIIEKLSKI